MQPAHSLQGSRNPAIPPLQDHSVVPAVLIAVIVMVVLVLVLVVVIVVTVNVLVGQLDLEVKTHEKESHLQETA